MLFENVGSDAVEEFHEFVSNGMLAVVLIHIAGVVVSSVLHRENLARAMVTGFKSAEPDQGVRRSYTWLGVIILSAVVAFWVGYPSTGLVTPSADTAQIKHHDDD
jgi:predicted membrane protein